MDPYNHSTPISTKLPILNTRKFEQWKFRIQQYLQHDHYTLWEVIEFGDSYKAPPEETNKDKGLAGKVSASIKKKGRNVAITAEDMQKRKIDVKARTTLLLALPDEHQLRFSKYDSAKELWEAILNTFGGNEATKRTKKNQLKQQYGNFKAKGSEKLEQTFSRLQAILSHLEFMDVPIEQDDLNQTFLTSLAPKWLVYTIFWRNRDDLDTMSLNDVYNHFKVYEPKVQKRAGSNSQNMVFISSSNTSSRKSEVPTIQGVSTASAQVSTDTTDIDDDDIEEMDIKWNLALLSMRADRFWKKTGKKITIQGSDVAGFDKSKVECFNYHKMGHFARECRSPRSQDRRKRESYKKDSKVEEPAPKKKNELEEVKKEKESIDFIIKFFENASKDLDGLLGSQKLDKDKKGVGFNDYCDVPPPPTQVYSPPKKYLSWMGLPEFVDDTVTDYTRPTTSIDVLKIPKIPTVGSKVPAAKPTVTADKGNKEKMLRPQLVGFENLSKIHLVKGIPQDNIDDKVYWDSGCSRHMTGNISYLSEKGIKREFSNARTPKQNGVPERRNRTLIKAARAILADAKLHGTFWSEAVNTVCYVQNRILVIKPHKKTPYELFNERSPAIGFIRSFGCHVMILNTLEYLGKFDAKGDEGYLVGYSPSSKAFRVFNKRTKKRVENLNVDFLENRYVEKGTGPDWLFDNDTLTNSMNYVLVVAGTSSTNISGIKEDVHQAVKEKESPLRFIALPNCSIVETKVPTVSTPIPTGSLSVPLVISSVPRIISRGGSSYPEPLSLGNAMSFKNRLEDFFGDTSDAVSLNDVEADLSNMETAIQVRVRPTGMKWVLKNKKDERGIVIRNKARLVAQRHTQEEGTDDEEVFAPFARIEAIRLFLAYASYMGFTVYQMDVKSVFLYWTIKEEVYVMQPSGFQDPEFPHKVYKVCREFEAIMHDKFQMSAMGELNFFLGLRVLQKKDGIFLSQDKYVGDILKKFGYIDIRSAKTLMDRENPWGKDGTSKDVELHLYRSMIGSLMYLTASRPDIMFAICACARHQVIPKECHLHVVKRIFRYLKGQPNLGLWYHKESPFDLVAYSDSYYGGANQDRKSTTGGCQFLGRRLISWQCKKRTIVFTSITEAEYVAAASGYDNVADLLTGAFDIGRFQYLVARSKQLMEKQKILAKVNGRQRTVSESSIGRHLNLNDEEDETAFLTGDARYGEAFPTVTSLDAGQDRENIAKTSSMPHEASPRVTFLGDSEGNKQQKLQELMDIYTSLGEKDLLMRMLQTWRMDQGEDLLVGDTMKDSDKSDVKGSDSTDDMANVLGTLGATNILDFRGLRSVFTTASLSVATASTFVSPAVATASGSFPTIVIFTTASVAPHPTRVTRSSRGVVIKSSSPIFVNIPSISKKDKGKGKMTKPEQPSKENVLKQMSAQLARDLEAKFAQEDQIIREQAERDSEIAKIHAERELKMMIAKLDRSNKIVAKYLKPTQEQQYEEPKELSKEELKKMMEIVPVKELYIEALQVKYPIIDWEIYSEDQRKYWKIIRVGNHIEVYQIFDDMLKKFDREDLDRLWSLVKESCSITKVTDEKEKELWVELKRLYEPDSRDPLWALQRYMYDPFVWRLYDTCVVHHVSTGRGHKIFMLVEKYYSLTKGLTTLMLCNKL
uniref:Integrase catalytic domain-containing protein n=1 Tax=Tanacetum cinerariifolium TaxID=118510 RepID=A0A6L2MJT5_TANCI|nr:hypothetical protein [Tanacetum cinerariifolium]